MAKYVYTMRRVSKTVPPQRTILKNISLNFFPGAKIGVLGLNGSGKSSLLKIMAGVDEATDGEVIRMPGINVGYLPQEPALDAAKTVREEVEAARSDVAEAKKQLDAVYAAYSEEGADFDKLAAEQARLEAIVNGARRRAGTGDRRGCPALAALGRENRRAIRRREAPRRAVQAAALQARPAAAR